MKGALFALLPTAKGKAREPWMETGTPWGCVSVGGPTGPPRSVSPEPSRVSPWLRTLYLFSGVNTPYRKAS